MSFSKCRNKRDPKSGVQVRCIRSIAQFREIDRRNETKDAFIGLGINEPTPKQYLYGKNRILREDQEVVECFKTRTQNRICLINAWEKATQNPAVSELPRYCLFDPKTGERLLEEAIDENGNKVLCIVNECRVRQKLSGRDYIRDRDYDCYTDSKGQFWQTERRNVICVPKKVKKRLLVQDSCNSQVINMDAGCCNAQQKRSTKYQQRRAHNLSRTRYACNQRPSGWKIW